MQRIIAQLPSFHQLNVGHTCVSDDWPEKSSCSSVCVCGWSISQFLDIWIPYEIKLLMLTAAKVRPFLLVLDLTTFADWH